MAFPLPRTAATDGIRDVAILASRSAQLLSAQAECARDPAVRALLARRAEDRRQLAAAFLERGPAGRRTARALLFALVADDMAFIQPAPTECSLDAAAA